MIHITDFNIPPDTKDLGHFRCPREFFGLINDALNSAGLKSRITLLGNRIIEADIVPLTEATQ